MNFISTNGTAPPVSFREAAYSGTAPDGGLYVPEQFPLLPDSLFTGAPGTDLISLGEEVFGRFVDDIQPSAWRKLLLQAWDFPIPLVHLEENLFLVELYHGPTLAFKDVGARFLAAVLGHFQKQKGEKLTVLVATSGDTGGAVAHGFKGGQNIDVFVLYPSGMISRFQEQQILGAGEHVHAIEIRGSFDDCQRLVKEALGDKTLNASRRLTTANSMNIARLLPQIVYYSWAYVQWARMTGGDGGGNGEQPMVVVPSGNFGNLTAAVYARSIGTPLSSFVAATNRNDVVPEFLRTGEFRPRPSVQTYSNAMDIGNPSNVSRLLSFYGGEVGRMRKEIQGVSISDEETLEEMRNTFERTGRIIDPHTAVGVAAARNARSTGPVFVAATAHPAKFSEVINEAIGEEPPLPVSLNPGVHMRSRSTKINATYDSLSGLLTDS